MFAATSPVLPTVAVTFAALFAAKTLPPRVAPKVATRLLTALCATALVLASVVVVALALTSLAQLHGVAEWLERCTRQFQIHTDRPSLLGALAALAIVGGATRFLAARRSQRSIEPLPGDAKLRIVEADDAMAYSIPGRAGHTGQIIVTSAMLASLTAPEQAVLFAHENAHLRLGHHRYARFAENAAAAAFFLTPVANAIRYSIERWADEDAAAVVGDRTLVARAVAHAALASSGGACPHPAALAMSESSVVLRVIALTQPPTQPSRLSMLVVSAFSLVAFAALVVSMFTLHHVAIRILEFCF